MAVVHPVYGLLPICFWNMTHYSWSMDQVAGTEWGDKGTYGDFIINSTIGIASLAPVVIMVFFKDTCLRNVGNGSWFHMWEAFLSLLFWLVVVI